MTDRLLAVNKELDVLLLRMSTWLRSNFIACTFLSAADVEGIT